MSDDELSEEDFGLRKRALFVEHPNRPIDLNTDCHDGSEYIHKVRLEELELIRRLRRITLPEETEQLRSKAREAAIEFSRFALELLLCGKSECFLREKFPKKLEFPKNDPSCIEEWCTFCLGSKLCSLIYKGSCEEPSEEIDGHLPVLSIVLHFNCQTAFTVLKHLHEWFLALGMVDSLCRWIYVVLACIKKPLDFSFKKLFETLYEDCEKRLQNCGKSEKFRLHLISAILSIQFCVYSDKVGGSSK